MLIYSGEIPTKPDTPTTTFNRDTVLIDWNEPFDGGSTITGYRIYIRESNDLTYSLELDDCDGSSSQTIIDASACSVKVTTLTNAPFNLPWGSEIYV